MTEEKTVEAPESETLQELVVVLKGQILESNFIEWKGTLLERVKASKRELKTDDDFVTAAADIKSLKAGEKSLSDVKEEALKQAAEINELFTAIDEVSEEAREARLALERQIKVRKAEIVVDLLKAGKDRMEDLLDACPIEYVESEEGQRVISGYESQSHEAIKGKKSTATMQAAIDKVIDTISTRVVGKSELVKANLKLINAYHEGGHAALLSDRSALSFMNADDMEVEIKRRIQQQSDAQAEKDKNAQLAIDAQASELEMRRNADQEEKPKPVDDDGIVERGGSGSPPSTVPVVKDQPQDDYQLMIGITTDIETFKKLARAVKGLGDQYIAFQGMTIDAGKKPKPKES